MKTWQLWNLSSLCVCGCWVSSAAHRWVRGWGDDDTWPEAPDAHGRLDGSTEASLWEWTAGMEWSRAVMGSLGFLFLLVQAEILSPVKDFKKTQSHHECFSSPLYQIKCEIAFPLALWNSLPVSCYPSVLRSAGLMPVKSLRISQYSLVVWLASSTATQKQHPIPMFDVLRPIYKSENTA